MRLVNTSVMLILVFSLSSCVKHLVKTVKKKTDLQYSVPAPKLYAENGAFKGLRDFIQTSQGRANVLLTHGLTDKTENHFDLLVERLAMRMDLVLTQNRKEVLVGIKTNRPGDRMLGFESWKLFEWKFETADKKPVSFYFVYWAPITKPAKDFIHSYNASIHRTALSSFVKDSLFINIFGDLALYLNEDYKFEMQRSFLDALEHINGPVAVVGGGFGVQLLFDAVSFELYKRRVKSGQIKIELAQEMNRSIDVKRVIALDSLRNPVPYAAQYDIACVYLLTNQIPFVSLLKLQPDNPPDDQLHNDQVYEEINNYCYLRGTTIDLVSFYDPNDPFGYVLPPFSDAETIRIRNVRLNIGETWRIDPLKTTAFILPLLKKQKGSDVFLNLIDQQSTVQDLMLNLRSPSNLTRSDYRVIGALADGSDYKLVTESAPTFKSVPRNLEPREVVKHPGLQAIALGISALIVKSKLELKSSILPFSLPSVFRDTCPTDIPAAEFNGIDQSIARNDVTQLMTVHGVKNQEPDSFDDLVNSIAKSLGFYGRPDSIRFVCAEGETCPRTGELNQSYRPGTVKITTFEGVSGQKLIIYAVYWSGVTKPAKDWLNSASIDKHASVVPTLIKRELINDGFADIELSFGFLSNKVDLTMKRAFHEMQRDYDSLRSTATFNSYYLTGSLGTRLLLDYLNNGGLTNTEVAGVHSRTRTWYMITNQLIMTALKDIPLNNGNVITNAISYERFYETSLGGMLQRIDDPANKLDIVAFNDPNDLMSFIVPDSVMGIGKETRAIYNTYLNLASGVSVNMDRLIRTVYKADKSLMRLHRGTYDTLISDFKKGNPKICDVKLKDTDPEFVDYLHTLEIAKSRFTQRRGRMFRRHAPDPNERINPDIERLLRKGGNNDEALEDLFNEKRKWYSYNLYATRKQMKKLKANYKHRCDSMGRKNTISMKNFKRLQVPGFIMPSIRLVTDYSHYQNFVVDFGRAHVGAKENSKVVQMISHGLAPVTKTNVDQRLYEWIHNASQKPCRKKS